MAKANQNTGGQPVPKPDERETTIPNDGPKVTLGVERPPVTTGPGGMGAPPPSLGREQEQAGGETRPPVSDASTAAPGVVSPAAQPVPATRKPTPDGQSIRDSGPPKQPERPDLSTQQPRNAGGSDPSRTHPDRPDMGGGLSDTPTGTEDEGLRAARERAAKGSGNVYVVNRNPDGSYKRITGATTDPDGWNGHITESDLPEGADMARLVRLGVITPLDGLQADPQRARNLGPEGMEEVDRLQSKLEEQDEEIERLRRELAEAKKK